jgi:hypothetical protein
MAAEIRWKRTFAVLLTGGVAGVFLAPLVAPALTRWSRPATKAALRAAMALYERGRQTAAELREMVEDTAAELAAERNGEAREEEAREESIPRHAAPAEKGEHAALH